MREVSQERLVKDAHRVLEYPFWIPELSTDECYSRLHDDHDGTFEGQINVQFSPDGDTWVSVDGGHGNRSLRFRFPFGGGMSNRVRNALMILALAIKLDNEKRPQEKPQKSDSMPVMISGLFLYKTEQHIEFRLLKE